MHVTKSHYSVNNRLVLICSAQHKRPTDLLIDYFEVFCCLHIALKHLHLQLQNV